MEDNQITTLFAHNEDAAKREDWPPELFPSGLEAAMFIFDDPEARGKVVIERGAYGVFIWVDGKCIGQIDLFHQSPEGKNDDLGANDPTGYPQICIYPNGEDDTLATVAWLKDGTVKTVFDRPYSDISVTREERTTTITYP